MTNIYYNLEYLDGSKWVKSKNYQNTFYNESEAINIKNVATNDAQYDFKHGNTDYLVEYRIVKHETTVIG